VLDVSAADDYTLGFIAVIYNIGAICSGIRHAFRSVSAGGGTNTFYMRHPATSNGDGAFDFVRRVRISFFNTQMGKGGCRGTSVRLSDFELPIYDADLDRHLQPHTAPRDGISGGPRRTVSRRPCSVMPAWLFFV
jgi:hypothetical protein